MCYSSSLKSSGVAYSDRNEHQSRISLDANPEYEPFNLKTIPVVVSIVCILRLEVNTDSEGKGVGAYNDKSRRFE